MVNRVSGATGQQAGSVSESAQAGYERLASLTGQVGHQVTRTVRQRPLESVAIVFGMGIVVGAFCLLGRHR